MDDERPSLGVVGAGASGASAAYALRDRDVDVTLFEKSRGLCGRAATRRRDGRRYDHGANYLKGDDETVTELVTERLPTDGLVEAAGPVWTFDGDGAVSEGRGDDDHKWTWEAGITQLAKRLLAATDATVHRETRVGRIERIAGDDQPGDGWRLFDDDDERLGAFDALLLTPPAPQTAALLGATDWADDRRERLQEAVADVSYRPILTAVAGYDRPLDRPYYALVNTDDGHDVGWVSREECKPGHVPDGESLLVIQMSPEWSGDRLEDDPAAWGADAVAATAELLDESWLADPAWTDTQRWRYALPNEGLAEGAADPAAEAGLFVAGDWVPGAGRLHAATRSGLDVGDRIGEHLG
jgi:predicted NAD/FAD-dependent oxidoreductase